ncbi:hypothetical protein NB311A_00255 [Nitrobacter sp. Nb-311A]|nr:hypothetical protein NB311A_00255 [Nitrobacter sp. Nb-311A]
MKLQNPEIELISARSSTDERGRVEIIYSEPDHGRKEVGNP